MVERHHRQADAATSTSTQNREGDHICYISDLTKMRTELKGWDISVSLPQIMDQLVRGWHERPKK